MVSCAIPSRNRNLFHLDGPSRLPTPVFDDNLIKRGFQSRNRTKTDGNRTLGGRNVFKFRCAAAEIASKNFASSEPKVFELINSQLDALASKYIQK